MFIRIGHRGACGYEPENTLPAFQKAIELGVDMVELDVHICKSGEIIVFHDDSLDKSTNGTGRIEDKSFDQLRLIDTCGGGKIPPLSDVLDLVDRRCKVNIELKGQGTAMLVAQLIDIYIGSQGWSHEDFLVSSFDYDELRLFRQVDTEIRVGINLDKLIDYGELAKELNAFSVHPSKDIVTSKFVEEAHGKGLKVFVWTVNGVEEIGEMKGLGVDGLFSDYPDRL